MPTKEQKRIRELEQENDELQDQLDQIFDIVTRPQEEGDDLERNKGYGSRARRNPN